MAEAGSDSVKPQCGRCGADLDDVTIAILANPDRRIYIEPNDRGGQTFSDAFRGVFHDCEPVERGEHNLVIPAGCPMFNLSCVEITFGPAVWP